VKLFAHSLFLLKEEPTGQLQDIQEQSQILNLSSRQLTSALRVTSSVVNASMIPAFWQIFLKLSSSIIPYPMPEVWVNKWRIVMGLLAGVDVNDESASLNESKIMAFSNSGMNFEMG